MRKTLPLILILLLLLPAFPAPAAAPTFTLMIYLCGANLESDGGSASDDLIELMDAGIELGGPVTVVVETGGAREWWMENIDPTRSERWVLDDETMYCFDSARRRDMGDAGTLADFIAWGVACFPADRYGLILWNHGGGSTGGVCYDEYTGNCLTCEDVHDALAASGVPRLDFIGFDACLMATFEMANYVRDFADYMLASEALMPGTGLDYATPLSALRADPAMDTRALCRLFVDAYMDASLTVDPDDTLTLSVVELSRMVALTEALEAVGGGLGAALDAGGLRAISRGRQTMRSFGDVGDAGSDMVDMGQFIQRLASLSGTGADALAAAYADAVVYSRYTERTLESASGLSILVPLHTREEFDAYSADYDPLGLYPAYADFLAGYTAMLSGGSYTFAAATPQVTSGWTAIASLGEDVTFSGWSLQGTLDRIDAAGPGAEGNAGGPGVYAYSMALTDEDMMYLSCVEGNLMIDISDGESEQYIDLGYLQHTLIDWDNGMVYSLFDGTWPTLAGQPVYMIDQSVTAYARRSLIDVTVNGEEAYLLAVFDADRPQGEILGYTQGYGEDGLPVRGYSRLVPGDVIIPNYYLYTYDGDGEHIDGMQGEAIVYAGVPLAFGYEPIGRHGEAFAYSFCLNDIFGDASFSDFIFFSL